MLVWRIENSAAKGPICGAYCGRFIDHEPPSYQFGDYNGPRAQAMVKAFAKNWVCGWNSEALMLQFPYNKASIDEIEEEGFRVFIFDTEQALLCPDGQVVFNRAEARIRDSFSPKNFFGPNWTPKGFYDY